MLTGINTRQWVVSKVASIAVGAFGLYIIWGIWPPIITRHKFDSYFDVVFLFIFPIPATILAAYFLYVAVKLWQSLSYKSVCKLSSVMSIILAILLLTKTQQLKPAALESSEWLWTEVTTLILMILAGLFYLAVKKCLLKWLCVKEEFNFHDHKRATELYFGFLALFIWQLISATTQLLIEEPQSKYIAKNHLLAILIFFGYIPMVFLFYRICMKLFLKKQPEQLSAGVEMAGDDNK